MRHARTSSRSSAYESSLLKLSRGGVEGSNSFEAKDAERWRSLKVDWLGCRCAGEGWSGTI